MVFIFTSLKFFLFYTFVCLRLFIPFCHFYAPLVPLLSSRLPFIETAHLLLHFIEEVKEIPKILQNIVEITFSP